MLSGKSIHNAEIAQLVEHNLAKVGVAGPSPVFRSRRQSEKAAFLVCTRIVNLFAAPYRQNAVGSHYATPRSLPRKYMFAIRCLHPKIWAMFVQHVTNHEPQGHVPEIFSQQKHNIYTTNTQRAETAENTAHRHNSLYCRNGRNGAGTIAMICYPT